MPPYGEPDWATPGDTANVATSQPGLSPSIVAPSASMSNTAGPAHGKGKARCIVLSISIMNMGLALLMGALGILALIDYKPDGLKNLATAFLPAYMVIFSSLLFIYEFIWWQPVAKLNVMFRKNFGFLYGLKGKGFYLIFIAFLTLGMRDDSFSPIKGLDWITGIGWLAGGCLHLFVTCTMPDVNQMYKPPTVGLAEMGVEEASGNNNAV